MLNTTIKPFQVIVRDTSFNRIGIVDDYTSFQMSLKFNDVGAMVMIIPAGSAKSSLLVEGNGLIVTRHGTTVMSGQITSVDWSVSESNNDPKEGILTVNVVDDMVLLQNATCWPNPTAAIGSQTSANYAITAVVAETAMRSLVNVNIGPGAQASRKIANLTLATSAGNGSSITKHINQFDNLLTNLQLLAFNDGLGFRLVQVSGNLQFQVYVPSDRSGTIRFALNLGNLGTAAYTTVRPTCTKAIVVLGGATGGSARVCKSYTQSDPIFPHLIVEQFIDQTSTASTDTNATAIANQAGADALANGAGQAAVTFTPVDIPLLQFGIDYMLGDLANIEVRGDWLKYPIQEVNIANDITNGLIVNAVAGTPGVVSSKDFVKTLLKQIAKIKKDQLKLQTRNPS